MIVYKCTCLLDDRVYIGITIKSLGIRKSHHLSKARRGSKLFFHKELVRLGFDNFTWEVIDEAKTKEESLKKVAAAARASAAKAGKAGGFPPASSRPSPGGCAQNKSFRPDRSACGQPPSCERA